MTKKKVSIAKRTKKVLVLPSQAPKKKKRRAKKKSSGLLQTVGSLAGGFLGGPTGAAIGGAAGRLISRVTGFGDYRVNQNSIVSGNSVPTFQQGGDGVRICHREFISDVQGSSSFTLTSYSINPGLSSTFPLLSCLADCFEEYEFKGLVFQYRPSSGTALTSSSAALGVVVLATDYDSLNPPFNNKQAMESYEYSSSTAPFTGCIHPVECMRNRNVLANLYTRTSGVPATGDVRMYDLGNFQIATQGMQSSYTVGELWVSYDVVFRKPRFSQTAYSYAHLFSTPAGSASATSPGGSSGFVLSTPSDAKIGVAPSPLVPNTSFQLQTKGYYMVAVVAADNPAAGIVLTYGTNIEAGIAAFNNAADWLCVVATSGVNNAVFASLYVAQSGNASDNEVKVQLTTLTSANVDVYVFPVPYTSTPPLAPPPHRPIGFNLQVKSPHFVPPTPPTRPNTPFHLVDEVKRG